MVEVDTFHLPGLEAEDSTGWRRRPIGGDIVLRTPELHPDGLRRQICRLRNARRRHLRQRDTGDLMQAIDGAAARLLDRASVERKLAEAVLPEVTGYSPAMIGIVLDRMAADWRREPLGRLLDTELEDPAVLDSYRPRRGGASAARQKAYGPELAFHVFAGNVPGVAVTSMVRSLLVRAATLGKTAQGEPVLPVLFARCLAAVDAGLGDCVAVSHWPGGDEELESAAMEAADLLVLYGGEEAIGELLRRAPSGKRVVVHGPMASLAVVGREALITGEVEETLAAAAEAVAIFDQQGCVSPHAIFVEVGGEIAPRDFAERLADELGAIEERIPRGKISAAEAAGIHRARAEVEFRELSGEDAAVFAGPGTSYTVLYEPGPGFTLSCLNRVVRVTPLRRLEDLADHLHPWKDRVQTVGLAGIGGRLPALAELLGRLGVSRIAELREMPWPPPWWHHDGRGPLRELLRWTDLEV